MKKITLHTLHQTSLSSNLHFLLISNLSILSALLLSGCNNTGLNRINDQLSAIKNFNPTVFEYKISNVSIGASQSGGANLTTTIFFDTTQNAGPVSEACQVSAPGGGTSKPCSCQISWAELNDTTGTSVTINRSITSDVSTVQPFSVSCPTPDAYTNEIPNGTIVNVTLIGALHVQSPFRLKKGSTPFSGNIIAEEGEKLFNIHRYSCYEKSAIGQRLVNKLNPETEPNSGTTVDVVSATQFCAAEGGASDPKCRNAGSLVNSAKSYYYNLFAPSHQLGGFNLENNRYRCPEVNESLNTPRTKQAYPLDTQFALSESYSNKFKVPVVAPSVLGIQGNGTTNPTTCQVPGQTSTTSATASSSAISYKCVGFAMKPDATGSCGSFKDSSGTLRQTYRLRRYFAIYPVSFDAFGRVIEQAQATDAIYVLDRPVRSNDPLKPYTMLGPKPCPFAYYDRTGVLDQGSAAAKAAYGSTPNVGVPNYKSTNSSLWSGKNVDGIAFPNVDSASSESCSAALPIIKYNAQGAPVHVSIATTHDTNRDATTGTSHTFSIGGGDTIDLTRVFVRPVKPWTPHYEEDLSFQACAPQSDPFVDPPLHFTKDSAGQVSYCAEAYPTQNDAISELDRKHNPGANDTPPGYVKPYTSHVVKNSASAVCTATPMSNLTALSYPDPSTGALGGNYASCAPTNDTRGAAWHSSLNTYIDSTSSTNHICANRTCDRTVGGVVGAWKGFPLLAEPSHVEEALRDDSSYRCTVTFDNGNGKAGKTTPRDGCCDRNVVFLTTGGSGGTYDSAHLEPDRACLSPNF